MYQGVLFIGQISLDEWAGLSETQRALRILDKEAEFIPVTDPAWGPALERFRSEAGGGPSNEPPVLVVSWAPRSVDNERG